jgi:spore germination protein YaaH
MSWLRPLGTLRVCAAIVVLVGISVPVTGHQLTAHAASRSIEQAAPSLASGPSPTPSPGPDQTKPSTSADLAPPPVVAGQASPSAQQTPGTASANARPTREIFGFATSGSLGDPNFGYPTWNFDLLSTVSFFALHSTYNGNLVADSDWYVFSSSTFTNFVNTAHAHGVKVVVTISPDNSADMCDNLYNDQHVIGQLLPQVTGKGLDGVNIDYEGQLATCPVTDPSLGSAQTNQALLTRFAKDLRAALNNAGPGYYLSIDTYSGSAAGTDGFFNIPDLNQWVDSFFVMAYDMDYSNYPLPPLNCNGFCMNPISPINTYYWNDATSMSQYSAVVGANKTILGLPLYGRVSCASSTYQNAHANSHLTAATYLEAISVPSSPDVKPGTFATARDTRDPAGLDRYDTWYDLSLGCWREMYWHDVTSLGARYNLANNDNLRGVGFWTLNYGGGSPELWDALSAYFQTWSAGYDISQTPTTWVASRPQTFAVTVTNSGSYTWPSGGTNPVKLDVHFATQPGLATSSWLTSEIYSLPSDVAPGASITFNVTATAPSTTGSLYIEAEMFKNQQFWFSQRQPLQVTVSPQTFIASYDMSQAPTTWQTGQSQTFNVGVTNTGNVPWPSTGANPVMLDLHFSPKTGGSAQLSSWLTSQIYSLPSDVNPGQTVTVSVTATAPAADGYMSLEAEMFKNQQFWFAQWKPVSVTVYGAWGASHDLSQAPASWGAGQTKTFTVTVTNQGTSTWPSGGANPVMLDLHFTNTPGGSAQIGSWLTSQIYRLPADVAPAGSATLTVSVTAPSVGGPTYLEAEMFKDQQFWFKEWSSVAITLSPAWVASYDMCQVQTTWAASQTQTVTLTVANTGADAWPSGGTNPVKLDLHFTTTPGGSAYISRWATSQVYALASDVAPGGTATFTVSATAPSAAGTYYLEAEMFKNQQFWFTQAQAVPASVGSVQWGANFNACSTPRTWTKGQSQTYQITLTNAGTQTWPSGTANPVELDIHFTTTPGGSGQIGTWLNSYIIVLPNDVAPGQSVTVSVTASAPNTSGPMYVEAEMFKNQQFWFAQWQPVAVTVS